MGSRVATVKVSDINSGDNVTITLDRSRSGIQGGGAGSGDHASDGQRYFGVKWHNANVPTSSGQRNGRTRLSSFSDSQRDSCRISISSDKWGVKIICGRPLYATQSVKTK